MALPGLRARSVHDRRGARTVRAVRKALLIAYIEAAKADPTTALLGTSGIFSHVLIEPADSPFASWLIERRIAVVTAGGEVTLPYGGSHLQISVLAHA
ncbi:hypothetical protein [Actinoallomurus iriomotensis]|uniref:Uncharacterized protein n=1 Tax=Actinoallomurus iriomotensis TaxID=478107 RepID=A0A9W6RS04_9ACTN|nr:hypothetical protein [Actinoallomurus iriomotensis]GLY80504.1 hypothetical protein Airi01_087710 [Actinoallomurus iriomotensis]